MLNQSVPLRSIYPQDGARSVRQIYTHILCTTLAAPIFGKKILLSRLSHLCSIHGQGYKMQDAGR